MSEAMGLDRLENAVRAQLAEADARMMGDATEGAVIRCTGEVKAYRMVLELISWTRLRDARAESEAKES